MVRSVYHPCDAKHEASTTDDFHDGFVDYNMNGKQDAGEGVIVWRGKRGDNNGHATTNLNMRLLGDCKIIKQTYIHIKKEPDSRFFFKIYRNC